MNFLALIFLGCNIKEWEIQKKIFFFLLNVEHCDINSAILYSSPFACIVWCCVVEHLTFTLGTHNRFIEGGFRLKDQNKPPTTHFDDLWHKSWRLTRVNINIRVLASLILFVWWNDRSKYLLFVTTLLHHIYLAPVYNVLSSNMQ